MNYQPQAKELAEAKTEHLWLKDVPGHCLQQTLMDLDRACREHGTWKVRWRSGRRWAPSFRFPEGNKMAVEKLSSGIRGFAADAEKLETIIREKLG